MPATLTRMPQVVARIWLAGMPRSISQALTSPPQTTGQPYFAAILSVSPRWSKAAWLTMTRSTWSKPVGLRRRARILVEERVDRMRRPSRVRIS